jgi:hypothetical protein
VILTWSSFYLICFLVGFGLSIVSVLAGWVHMPHVDFHHGIHFGHAHGGGGGASWFNMGTISAFLAWFGGTGYLLQHYYGIWFVAALVIATLETDTLGPLLSKNSNPWTGSYSSPVQTRPRLLRGSLVLRGAGGPRGGADAIPPAPPS